MTGSAGEPDIEPPDHPQRAVHLHAACSMENQVIENQNHDQSFVFIKLKKNLPIQRQLWFQNRR